MSASLTLYLTAWLTTVVCVFVYFPAWLLASLLALVLGSLALAYIEYLRQPVIVREVKR